MCLTIFDSKKETSLESGEELLCTHEQAIKGHGAEWSPPDHTANTLAHGGFPLLQGKRVNVAGVSNLFRHGKPIAEEEYRQRLGDAPEFLALHFRVRLARVRGATPPLPPAITSIRSPLRDRSYMASIARPVAPHTDYRNAGTAPARLCGVGTFLSAIKVRDAPAAPCRIEHASYSNVAPVQREDRHVAAGLSRRQACHLSQPCLG